MFLFHLSRDFRRRCGTDCSRRQRLADESLRTRENTEVAVVAMNGEGPILREQDVERQVVRLEETLDRVLLGRQAPDRGGAQRRRGGSAKQEAVASAQRGPDEPSNGA